jgi:hypothetical protein
VGTNQDSDHESKFPVFDGFMAWPRCLRAGTRRFEESRR